MAKSRGKMMKIGTAGRIHRMGTGVSVESIYIETNGAGMRAIMQSDGAQEAVNNKANSICSIANSSHITKNAQYVVHPKVLTVSAHAFIDPDNFEARLDQHHHQTLEKAFWQMQGR